MTSERQHPALDDLLDEIGEVGAHLSAISACEGASSNISLHVGWPLDPRRRFPVERSIELPQAVPDLAGHSFVVTGSGCRLRRIRHDPPASLAVLTVDEGGKTARLFLAANSGFSRPTVEFNTHLAVHEQHARSTGRDFNAIVHGHPLHLTYLSHLRDFGSADGISRRLMRWQAETIVFLPDGVGHVPFFPPSTDALRAATVDALTDHRVAVWAQHGAIARSDDSVSLATDYIDYLETAARYEVLNLALGEPTAGLTAEQVNAIARTFGLTVRLA